MTGQDKFLRFFDQQFFCTSAASSTFIKLIGLFLVSLTETLPQG